MSPLHTLHTNLLSITTSWIRSSQFQTYYLCTIRTYQTDLQPVTTNYIQNIQFHNRRPLDSHSQFCMSILSAFPIFFSYMLSCHMCLYYDFSPSRYLRALGVFLSIEFPSIVSSLWQFSFQFGFQFGFSLGFVSSLEQAFCRCSAWQPLRLSADS